MSARQSARLYDSACLVFTGWLSPICEIIDFKITRLASEELTMQILYITCTVNKKPVSVNTGNICDLRIELFSGIRWIT